MRNLTLEEVKKLPEMLEKKSQEAVAEELGISQPAINYWVEKLREKGVEIKSHKKEGLIDKIFKNASLSVTD